jgi:ribosomal protein S18 acetylase RimI-like enzyme
LLCRVAVESDLDAILVMMDGFNRYEGIPFTRDGFRAPLLALITGPQLGAVLLFEDAGVLGYAVVTWGFDLEFGGRDAFLTELWVEPQFRGHGRGRAALAHVESFARQQGAGALHLGVRHENAAAVSLYESGGYRDWPRRFMTKLLA